MGTGKTAGPAKHKPRARPIWAFGLPKAMPRGGTAPMGDPSSDRAYFFAWKSTTAACAAASLATGTRYGLQDT